MASIKCFICGDNVKEDEERGTIKEKALKTFIEASKRRKDGHDKWLVQQTSVIVHEKCRKGAYTKESSILKAEKEAKKTRVTRKQVNQFDFKKLCIYCEEDASEGFKAKQKKRPQHSRDTVHEVMSLETIQSIRNAANARGDEWGESVLRKLANETDLVAAEGRYHGSCYRRFFVRRLHGAGGPSGFQKPPGRPEDVEISECADFIASYMEENEDVCQFSLDEILRSYQGTIPRKDHLLDKLSERFGENVIVVRGTNQFRQPTICYRNTGHKILTNNWYESRSDNADEERMRVVKAAAEIIREDIRSKVYILDKYPSPDMFLQNASNDIPDSLQLLLETMTTSRRKRDNEEKKKMQNKVQAIAHSLIALTRPRSFTSSILLGVGTLLYRKYGSRHLVDVLSALGFSSSYGEVRKFEVSTLQQSLDIITNNSFTQFIFDNADVNMDTIDGRDTFHAMGGIQCFTPKASLTPRTPIEKVKTIPKATSLREYGSIALQHFVQPSESGLATLVVKMMTDNVERDVMPRSADLLWMFGKWSGDVDLPGWNGFMETITSNQPYSTSRVLCLPFITAPPSDIDTIYTALTTAAKKCKEQRQTSCFVTFDHPLWLKARKILASCGPDSELSCVTVRLGGFHLLMSFMGAIGFIMDGSGLQDLWSVCFAMSSTKTMMSGHYYSRAVRAHILTQLALAKIILQAMSTSPETRLTVKDIDALSYLITDFSSERFDINNPHVDCLMRKFKRQLEILEERGNTAKLWVQYFRMVSILKQFIEAERSGNWDLHLKSLRNMIPYFHASGHFNYAKASHLYLQDMEELEKKLTPAEYEQFVVKGYFTIRRSKKHWSGIWSDMTIEQVLMRAISSCGGLSRGRGISDGTLARWIAGMPTAVDVCQQIEEYCGVTFSTSDQHVDTTNSRMRRDDSDLKMFSEWFQCHDPFPEMRSLMSISTGVTGDDSINCHEAFEKGTASMKSIEGKNFKEIQLIRKNRIVALRAVTAAAKINGESAPISTDTIFRRIPFHLKSKLQLESYFEFELAPYPLSLFDDEGMMRKTRKSELYKLFTPIEVDLTINADYVVDGGFLLHRVVWNSGEMFSDIIHKYVQYVKSHYNSGNITVVFDGYPEDVADKNIKSAERARRARALSSSSVIFEENTKATMPKERFLLNDHNKKRLISMVTKKLIDVGIHVKQASEDADSLIVRTAIQRSTKGGNVFIVGGDIDLLVLLTFHSAVHEEPLSNVFLMKPGKYNQETVVYSPSKCQLHEDVKKHTLFLHAFTGCDTTSSFFRQGKMKIMKKVASNKILHDQASVFLDPVATPDEIADAGVHIVKTLYTGGSSKSLNQVRFDIFQRSLSKKNLYLACLPPTEAAARQHSFRVYLQVQAWRGNIQDPKRWGWKITTNGLTPITTTDPPAPQELLNSISCTCKTGCKTTCSCRKAGIKCTTICINCKGHACLNAIEEYEEVMQCDEEIDMLEEEEEQVVDHLSEDDEEAEEGDQIIDERPSSSKPRKKPIK